MFSVHTDSAELLLLHLTGMSKLDFRCGCGQYHAQVDQNELVVLNECFCGSCSEGMEFSKAQTPDGKTSKTSVSAASQLAGLAPRGIALYALKPGAGEVISGRDTMVSFKLTMGSNVIRYYSSCCGTLIAEMPMKGLCFFPEYLLDESQRNLAPTRRGFVNVSPEAKQALEKAGVNLDDGEGIKILPIVCCGSCMAVGPRQPPFWNNDPNDKKHRIVNKPTSPPQNERINRS